MTSTTTTELVPAPSLYQQALAALRAPAGTGVSRSWFWISLIAFVVLSRNGGWKIMLVLVPLLLFHELGHWAAMRAFGHDDARIFFLPFLGAVTTSRKTTAHSWQRAVILLAGPLPGIVLGAVLVAVGGPFWHAVGRMLILINGLNLLPFEPLDGGRLVSTLFISRTGRLESAFTMATTAIGIVYAIATGQVFLGIAFGFTFVFLPLRARAAASAAALTGEFPTAIDACDEPQLQQLFQGALHVVGGARTTKPAAVASWMRNIHERRLSKRPSGFLAVALVGAYLGSAVLAAAVWFSEPAELPDVQALRAP